MPALSEQFDLTLATLRRSLPEKFSFRVEDSEFRDLGSLADAQRLSRAMEDMKHNALAVGYDTEVRRTTEGGMVVWDYIFTRRPEATLQRMSIGQPETPIDVRATEVRDA